MYQYATKLHDQYMVPIPYQGPGFEFAATSARNIQEIDARDSRLK